MTSPVIVTSHPLKPIPRKRDDQSRYSDISPSETDSQKTVGGASHPIVDLLKKNTTQQWTHQAETTK